MFVKYSFLDNEFQDKLTHQSVTGRAAGKPMRFYTVRIVDLIN